MNMNIPKFRLKTFFSFLVLVVLILVLLLKSVFAAAVLENLPRFPEDVKLTPGERSHGGRGKIGCFVLPPSFAETHYCELNEVQGVKGKSIYVHYLKKGEDRKAKQGFCGWYIVIAADLSQYKTITFMIKGKRGGETFQIGVNDLIANRREDAVVSGSIYRYLPDGITTDWQKVIVPLEDFYGAKLSRFYSITFDFNEEGEGEFYVSDFCFHRKALINRKKEFKKSKYLLLDDFDHPALFGDINLLGRKANVYKKLPSYCLHSCVKDEHYGETGRALRLEYNKSSAGWCGYYTLLNQIDGKYFNLKSYDRVSFMVKGASSGENFEIGIADKKWAIIGDSLKAGPVSKYLPGGVTTEWQQVTIPLRDFGKLDFSRIGSFVINFYEDGEGVVYIDNLTFWKKGARQ